MTQPRDRAGPGLPVLVLGATGGQGGAVARALLQAGRPVRALVRDPAAPRARTLAAAGAGLAPGDFTDVTALTAAMRGTAAAFALTTPFESGPDAEIAQGQAIVAAAQTADLPFLLFSSVAGALARTGVPHFESKGVTEQALAGSGVPHAVIAPTYFYDNALGGYDDIMRGVLELSLPPQHPLQQLDRDDLGRFAALVLASPHRFGGLRIELAGDAPTPEQMAGVLSQAAGRDVRFREVALSSLSNPDMAAMWRFLHGRGYQADIAGLARDYPETGWTSFSAWAARAVRPA